MNARVHYGARTSPKSALGPTSASYPTSSAPCASLYIDITGSCKASGADVEALDVTAAR